MAAFSLDGKIIKEHKFPTDHDYGQFLKDIERECKNLSEFKFEACCVAAPGTIDRKAGVVRKFGNIPWQNVPIAKDLGDILDHKVMIENDANLAALSEALLVQDKYKRVVYITLSTGIGAKIIINGMISQEFADVEAGFMIFEHEGKLTEWEEFASGQALKDKYGKLASEIEDPAIWKEYAANVARGLYELIDLWYPEVVIIGGGVGAHFEKFEAPLKESLAKYRSRMTTIPPIIKAKRPEEAVVYGCYDFIKQSV
ncbi:MAG TPA: ROK family protein [Candidatus Saccharimonadales bacterium]|nr:ROK family protein [Candidatus Saccharimonadales bacterium]